jgi:hypothetical protein
MQELINKRNEFIAERNAARKELNSIKFNVATNPAAYYEQERKVEHLNFMVSELTKRVNWIAQY